MIENCFIEFSTFNGEALCTRGLVAFCLSFHPIVTPPTIHITVCIYIRIKVTDKDHRTYLPTVEVFIFLVV